MKLLDIDLVEHTIERHFCVFLNLFGIGSTAIAANTNAVVVSTTGTSIPVLPGSLEIISAPADSYFNGITITGNSNISLYVAGNATAQFVVTSTGANIAGTANVVGNANVGNIGTAGVYAISLSATANANVGNLGTTGVFATTVSATGNANVGNLGTTGIFSTTLSATGNANVGNIGATNIVGTLTTAAQPNITSVGTLTTLTVSGNANVGNIGATAFVTPTTTLNNGLNTTGNVTISDQTYNPVFVGNATNTGYFTITNGGVFGSLMSTPILNMPQSGILGMHKIQDRPVVVNGQIVIRPMMYLALSYDHRLIDGREAVTFLVALKNAIEDPTRILIDL